MCQKHLDDTEVTPRRTPLAEAIGGISLAAGALLPPGQEHEGVLPATTLAVSFMSPAAPKPEARRGSRRRRLWDLPHKCHCPVVGVCFTMPQLRRILLRCMHLEPEQSDYDLHTTAVSECGARTPLAELMQRDLEARFALVVDRFAAVKDAAGLRAKWQTERCGARVAGALWAAWTHPACDEALEREIFGDIHMLQHQLGQEQRSEETEWRELRQGLREARLELLRQRAEEARRREEHTRQRRDLRAALAGTQAEAAAARALAETRGREIERLLSASAELGEFLLWRSTAQETARQLRASRRRVDELEKELVSLRAPAAAQVAERSGASAGNCAEEAHPSALPALEGRCVLCVGGRSGQVEAYRAVVEGQGGRFLHHDGGVEENVHRIDANLAAADLVICQAGCISHGAYWRVKDWCKRRGKPCVFVKSAGVTAFSRSVAAALESGTDSGG